MIYGLADMIADGFMWGLLHGLLLFVVFAGLYLLFTLRSRDHD